MADIDRQPVVRLRSLGHELRKLREGAGMTIQQVADQLEWSTAKVSRLENGLAKRPDLHHIRLLCEMYGVQRPEFVEGLVSLAREARTRGWWIAYRDIFTDSYIGFEAAASEIRNFEPLVIPGLLQTADYIAEIAKAASARDPREIERRVEARLERQRILTREDPPHLWAVIDEAALMRPFGSREVHERQLRRLIDTSPMDHVKIQILPISAGLHAGLAGQFVILDFPNPIDQSVVFLETATDGLFLEQPQELSRYRLLFQHVCASALSVDASIAYLSNLIDKL